VLTIKLSNVEIARMEILTKPGVAAATPIVELTLDADKFEVATTPEAAANATPADGKFISAK